MRKWIVVLCIIVFIIGTIVFFAVRPEKNTIINVRNEMAGKSVSINIYKGKQYLHDFKVNSFLKIKTPPQMAVWVEDAEGNYMETLYATSKIVRQNWSKAPSDPAQKGQIRRDEALPYWTHKRGNEKNVPDTVTSATPKGSSTIHTKVGTAKGQYTILAEVNLSTDFNAYYPREAKAGEENYSGGEFGSGQPALVYAATINAEDNKTYELVPIGHSSPDGKDGKLYRDLSRLTTAGEIVDKITFTVKK